MREWVGNFGGTQNQRKTRKCLRVLSRVDQRSSKQARERYSSSIYHSCKLLIEVSRATEVPSGGIRNVTTRQQEQQQVVVYGTSEELVCGNIFEISTIRMVSRVL